MRFTVDVSNGTGANALVVAELDGTEVIRLLVDDMDTAVAFSMDLGDAFERIAEVTVTQFDVRIGR